jgi:hypothetical protein
MMISLADLQRTVQATLASKRLGRPVFVRFTWQGQDAADAVVARLARAVGVVQSWLGQPLERVHAVGSATAGQVALSLLFVDGATALVSFCRTPPRGDGLDLIVLGNHGAIYHDAGHAVLWDEPIPLDAPPDPNLLRLIEHALKSGKPVPGKP